MISRARFSARSYVDNTSHVFPSRTTTSHNVERIGRSGERVEGLLGGDSPPLQFDFTLRCHSCHSLFQQGKLQSEVARLMRTQIHQQGSCALAMHLPGDKNVQADRLSQRGGGANGCASHLPILRKAWKILRVSPTRDVFSADHNHRLPLFWTWRPSPFAEKVNAFAHPWDFPTMGPMFCVPLWPRI